MRDLLRSTTGFVLVSLSSIAMAGTECPVTWHVAASTGPTSRAECRLAFDRDRERVVLFGGAASGPSTLTNDTWEWDGVAWSERIVPARPKERAEHGLAYCDHLGVVALFGGYITVPCGFGNCPSQAGDLWTWDGTNWQFWTPPPNTPVPAARRAFAMAYDKGRERLVVFGGAGDSNAFGDTWEWDGVQWYQSAVAGPSPMYYISMAYDDIRERIVLYGGTLYPAGDVRETWELSGQGWLLRDDKGLLVPDDVQLVYDERRERVLMAASNGGSNGNYQTYQWSGDGWVLIGLQGPHWPNDTRRNAGISYDAARGEVVSFGSAHQDGPGHETWTLRNVECPADLDCSGAIDTTDLNILLSAFGCSGGGCTGDIDEDGDTDTTDLNIILSAFGSTCGG